MCSGGVRGVRVVVGCGVCSGRVRGCVVVGCGVCSGGKALFRIIYK